MLSSPPSLPPSQDPLPWATCPLNSNRTGYEEECDKTSSTQYFWYRQTLNISPSLEASGSVQWEQALCLTLAWLVVYLCILRGTESTGKVRAGAGRGEDKGGTSSSGHGGWYTRAYALPREQPATLPLQSCNRIGLNRNTE